MTRYIDADALIRKICGMKCGCERKECGYDEAGCPQVSDLETAPTISLDEVRGIGKWIPLDYSDEAYGDMYKCAKCGCSEIGEPNYCPNCGAKMEVTSDVL